MLRETLIHFKSKINVLVIHLKVIKIHFFLENYDVKGTLKDC